MGLSPVKIRHDSPHVTGVTASEKCCKIEGSQAQVPGWDCTGIALTRQLNMLCLSFAGDGGLKVSFKSGRWFACYSGTSLLPGFGQKE